MIVSQVDTPRLIPCSAINSLNTFSKKKLAECVGKEQDVGKAVSEGHECVPSAESGRPKMGATSVRCVFGE